MNYSDVVKHMSKRLSMSQCQIRRLLKCSIEIFRKTLDEDKSFTIPKLGTFGTHVRPKRKAYNPFHKKIMILPPKRVAFFHPGSVLKEHIKDHKADNEQ